MRSAHISNHASPPPGRKAAAAARAHAPIFTQSPAIQKQPCACGGNCPRCQQPQRQATIAVGQSNDGLEQQADRVAEQVSASPAKNPIPAIAASKQGAAGMPQAAPSILQSSGKPLDAATRSMIEPRLGRNLSAVRVHTDRQAAQSAQAMRAEAYTAGNHIAFNHGKYAPDTAGGKQLLAHELTHVVQQGSATGSAPAIQRKAMIGAQILVVDEAYKKTVKDTWGQKALNRLIELSTDAAEHKFANWGELVAEYERAKKAPDPAPAEKKADAPAEENVCASLPVFAQHGGTCATASLITPVLIWDSEKYNSADPNPRLKSIAQKMQAYMLKNKETLAPLFEKLGKTMYQDNLKAINNVIELSADPGFKVNDAVFHILSTTLMVMSEDKAAMGLQNGEMGKARETLGFPGVMQGVVMFDEFFKKGEGKLGDMKPGQMAQVTWLVNMPATGAEPAHLESHAFTIGRLASGTWILNDQGADKQKPLCLTGVDMASLKDAMIDAAAADKWAGVTDNKAHQAKSGAQTGYTILGDEKTVLK